MMGTRHIRRRYTRDAPPGISEQHAYSYWCQPVFHLAEFPTAGKVSSSASWCFGEQALRHFLFLEPPEGVDLKDAAVFEALGDTGTFFTATTAKTNFEMSRCLGVNMMGSPTLRTTVLHLVQGSSYLHLLKR
jgi:hypothetical protein